MAQARTFVILDGNLPCIDRFGMTSGRDRLIHPSKHNGPGVNVLVSADPVG